LIIRKLDWQTAETPSNFKTMSWGKQGRSSVMVALPAKFLLWCHFPLSWVVFGPYWEAAMAHKSLRTCHPEWTAMQRWTSLFVAYVRGSGSRLFKGKLIHFLLVFAVLPNPLEANRNRYICISSTKQCY
jgi:hypothetical protein